MGMRRRGYPAAAIVASQTIGITKTPSTSDVALLEHAVRQELNFSSSRRMAVMNPLEIELTNWPEDEVPKSKDQQPKMKRYTKTLW